MVAESVGWFGTGCEREPVARLEEDALRTRGYRVGHMFRADCARGLWDLKDASFADERIERKVDHATPLSQEVRRRVDVRAGMGPNRRRETLAASPFARAMGVSMSTGGSPG